jgi:FAD/FMN-containing dehydrogenase
MLLMSANQPQPSDTLTGNHVLYCRGGYVTPKGVQYVDVMKQALVGLLGDANVSDDPDVLASYARDESFVLSIKPRVVVRPGSEDEVQALVTWANQTSTPLVPVSSGPPHFYGDTVPSVPGAAVVDLSRMDRIIKMDRRNRIAVIEPGVTYAQLQPALAKEGLAVVPPLYPRANKSVVASLLERQPTLIPRYNYALPEPLRNCGVVWGDGQRFSTGESGNSVLDIEAQWDAGRRLFDPKGPAQTDFFRLLTGAQGTLGIVAWASVRVQLIPEAKKTLFVSAPKLDDLVDLSYRLTRLRVGDELLIVNAAYLAMLVATSPDEVAALREALPAWVMIIGVGGRGLRATERVAVSEQDIAAEVATKGLRLQTAVSGVPTSRIEAVLDGVASGPHWKLRAKGGVADIFFHTTLEHAPGYLATMLRAAATHGYPVADVGVYLQPQHQGVSYHMEFSLPYAPEDKADMAKVRALYSAASSRLIAEGAYFSRPYGEWADPVYNRDAATRDTLRVVKKILDPNNILNPSKLCF